MSRYRTSFAWIIAAILCTATALAVALPDDESGKQTNHHAIRRYLIVHGDSSTGSWDDNDSPSTEELRRQFGERFAWFRQNGHEYIVTASEVMDELDRAMAPQRNVNRMQAEVNREQGHVNAMQAVVNAHQGDVNAMQGQVNESQSGVDQASVNRKQADVNAEQRRVNAEQAKVNAMQEKVNAEQRRVSAEFDRRVEDILDSALQSAVTRKLR